LIWNFQEGVHGNFEALSRQRSTFRVDVGLSEDLLRGLGQKIADDGAHQIKLLLLLHFSWFIYECIFKQGHKIAEITRKVEQNCS
jgi:hypothetical protein